MTPEQSKQLKVGTRVCFNGDPADSGKVISIEARYVTMRRAPKLYGPQRNKTGSNLSNRPK
jgi:hypothetical protein